MRKCELCPAPAVVKADVSVRFGVRVLDAVRPDDVLLLVLLFVCELCLTQLQSMSFFRLMISNDQTHRKGERDRHKRVVRLVLDVSQHMTDER